MLIQFLESELGTFSNAWTLQDGEHNVQVLKFSNQPFTSVNTYVTVGVSHYLLTQDKGSPIRQEFFFSADARFSDEEIASFVLSFSYGILSSSRAVKRGEVIGPGTSLITNVSCNGIFITPPVFFGDSFSVFNNGKEDIFFCWLFPLLEEEIYYIKEFGWSKFEIMLEKNMDVSLFWDLNRTRKLTN